MEVQEVGYDVEGSDDERVYYRPRILDRFMGIRSPDVPYA